MQRIESIKADQRQKDGKDLSQNSDKGRTDVQNSAPPEEQGKTRDKVAASIGHFCPKVLHLLQRLPLPDPSASTDSVQNSESLSASNREPESSSQSQSEADSISASTSTSGSISESESA